MTVHLCSSLQTMACFQTHSHRGLALLSGSVYTLELLIHLIFTSSLGGRRVIPVLHMARLRHTVKATQLMVELCSCPPGRSVQVNAACLWPAPAHSSPSLSRPVMLCFFAYSVGPESILGLPSLGSEVRCYTQRWGLRVAETELDDKG